jgi:hypothetical protein
MVAQALWHLELAGGDEIPMLVRNDFQITNASLTETVADVNDRSVVKVAFEPRNPATLKGEDDDDEEDSDDEDDMEGLDPEDLESDEEDDEAVKEFKQEMRAKLAVLSSAGGSKKVNGAAAAAADEDEDEVDEDEDDDEDFSISEEPVDIALCALTPGKIEQVQLNLIFNEDDVVVFKNTGKK